MNKLIKILVAFALLTLWSCTTLQSSQPIKINKTTSQIKASYPAWLLTSCKLPEAISSKNYREQIKENNMNSIECTAKHNKLIELINKNSLTK